MRLASLIHIVSIGGILFTGLRSPFLPLSRAVIALFLLEWGVLILTAQLLSLFWSLNNTWAYVGTSIVIACGTSLLLKALPLERAVSIASFPSPFSDRAERYLACLLGISGALALLGVLTIAWGILPSNPDSITYRFSRVFWYFGHGSLTHFTNSAEPRALYYPYNAALAYLPLVHFQLGPRAYYALSVICWIATGLTTYAFARNLGGNRFLSMVTAWIVLLTPNVLIQSVSTNDELIAAAPMVAGLYFFHRWYLARQPFDFLLGCIGVSISVGTKLHAWFYWPLLLAVAVALLVHWKATLTEVKNWISLRGLAIFSIALSLVTIFSLSFLAYNFFSTGKLFAWKFAAEVGNRPFSLQVAIQTSVLYAAQIVLTPFADLHLHAATARAAQHYAWFNESFEPLFRWVDNGPRFTTASYRFAGVTSPSAIMMNEQTIFIGFTWLIAFLALIWTFTHRFAPHTLWSRLHAASLPVYFLTYSFSTRYIEGFTVYITYAVIVAGPTFVYAYGPVASPVLKHVRIAILCLAGVANCFLAGKMLVHSAGRNVSLVWHASSRPLSPGFDVDESVQDEIGRAKNGVVHHTVAWEQAQWAFMVFHPEIRHYFASNPLTIDVPPDAPSDPDSISLRYSRYVLVPPDDNPQLHIYQFRKWTLYGNFAVIRIPNKASPGLTFIGNLLFALGPEWVFAAGNNVAARNPKNSGYVAISFSETTDLNPRAQPVLEVSPTIYGIGARDNLEFRYTMEIDGKLIDKSDWRRSPAAKLKSDGLTNDNGVLTISIKNNNVGGAVTSQRVVLRSLKIPQADATHP